MSIFVLIPIAYYPSFLRYHMPGTTDFNYFHYWWRTMTVGPWPSGQSWFLWVLLALDVIAAALLDHAPRLLRVFGLLIYSLRARPWMAFAAFVVVSVVVYVPMRLFVGDMSWFEPTAIPFPIQTSRILLYPGYFLTGVGIGVISLRAGILARTVKWQNAGRSGSPLRRCSLAAILLLVFAHHNWIENVASPPLCWRAGYGMAFAIFSAAMAFTVLRPSRGCRASSLWLLDAMRPSAYGIFLIHYMFIIWLQYAVYDYAWPAVVKSAIVFAVTLARAGWLRCCCGEFRSWRGRSRAPRV